jgi:hypothetical protein
MIDGRSKNERFCHARMAQGGAQFAAWTARFDLRRAMCASRPIPPNTEHRTPAALCSGEYPMSLSYHAHLKNREK